MPSSPYRRSPRDQRSRRDNRYRQRSSPSRHSSQQSHRKSYQQNDRYRRSNQRQRTRNKQHHKQQSKIRVENKQKIEVKLNNPMSEIKVHFRFDPLKVSPKRQGELIASLKEHISKNMGQVSYFEKSYDSEPYNLVLELGFKYDNEAYLNLNGKLSTLEVKVDGELLTISAKPSRIFELWLKENEKDKKKTGKKSVSKSKERDDSRKQKNKKRRHSHSKSRRSSGSSSSSSRSRRSRRSRRSNSHQRKPRNSNGRVSTITSRNDRPQRNERTDRSDRNPRTQRKPSPRKDKPSPHSPQRKKSSRSPQKRVIAPISFKKPQAQRQSNPNTLTIKQQPRRTKKVYIFGIDYSVNAKDMVNYLEDHPDGPFKSKKELTWRRVEGSVCEVLECEFDEKDAIRLMENSDKLDIKSKPILVVQSQSIQKDKLLQKLSQYQLNIQLPQKVHPYSLWKGLKQCGRIVQLISNNKLSQQGTSEYFNVTFDSKQLCKKLKTMKKTQRNIIIQHPQQDQVCLVYRTHKLTELAPGNLISSNSNNLSNPNPSNRISQEKRSIRSRSFSPNSRQNSLDNLRRN